MIFLVYISVGICTEILYTRHPYIMANHKYSSVTCQDHLYDHVTKIHLAEEN